MGMEMTYIYALVDPRTDEVRYVGKSDNPKLRLRFHKQEARSGSRSYKNNWLRSLMGAKLLPHLIILESVPMSSWDEVEKRWIRYYREIGARLTNQTDGGEGVINLSEDARQRQAESLRKSKQKKRFSQGKLKAIDALTIKWDSDYQRWRATVFIGEEVLLGYFYDPNDAVFAYEGACGIWGLPDYLEPPRLATSPYEKLVLTSGIL
jgi:hypothetical protein